MKLGQTQGFATTSYDKTRADPGFHYRLRFNSGGPRVLLQITIKLGRTQGFIDN